jgi:hypothetical protein
MKIFRKLNDWANSWSVSQLLFVFIVTGACLALSEYKTHIIHQQQKRIEAQENKIWAYELLLKP